MRGSSNSSHGYSSGRIKASSGSMPALQDGAPLHHSMSQQQYTVRRSYKHRTCSPGPEQQSCQRVRRLDTLSTAARGRAAPGSITFHVAPFSNSRDTGHVVERCLPAKMQQIIGKEAQ
jgi:hypothetical protein